MAKIERSIEIDAPLFAVYGHLARVEEFPLFMRDVREVRRFDAKHLAWRVDLAGATGTSEPGEMSGSAGTSETSATSATQAMPAMPASSGTADQRGVQEWKMEITQQLPGERIAWQLTDGPRHTGLIALHPVGAARSRLDLRIELPIELPIDPDSSAASADNSAAASEHIEYGLAHFKRFVEQEQRRGQGAQQPRLASESTSAAGYATGGVAGDADAELVGKTVGRTAYEREQSARSHAPGEARLRDWLTRRPTMPELLSAWQKPLRFARRVSHDVQQVFDSVVGRPFSSSATSGRGLGRSGANRRGMPGQYGRWHENNYRHEQHFTGGGAINGAAADGAVERGLYEARSDTANDTRNDLRADTDPPTWTPAVETAQREHKFIVCAELPGVKRDDVCVEIKHDRVTIEGHRRPEPQHEPSEQRRSERSYGHFYRVISLPAGADLDAASASMHDGMLEISVPISAHAQQARRLDVRGQGE